MLDIDIDADIGIRKPDIKEQLDREDKTDTHTNTFRSSSTVKTVVKKVSINSKVFARGVGLPSGNVSRPAICASAAFANEFV